MSLLAAVADFRKVLREDQQHHADIAKEMLDGYDHWRIKAKIDSLEMFGPEAPFLVAVRGLSKDIPDANVDPSAGKLYPFYPYMGGICFHKFDKDGYPIIIERIGLYDAKGFAANANVETLMDMHIRIQEYMFETVMKAATARSGKEITKQTVVFDCEGMGLHQLHPPALALLRALADHDAKYYPERLGRLFLVNAPPAFTRVWGLIRRWLDKGILEKIHILGDDYQDILLQYIDHENLPAHLGGTCRCAHMEGGCVPLARPKKALSDEDFASSCVLKDPATPHTFSLMVPMEEQTFPLVTYRFRSTKKPVVFEVHHRAMGSDESEIVIERSLHESHTTIIEGTINAKAGFYTFSWSRPPRSGLAAMNIGSTALEYTVVFASDSLSLIDDGNVELPGSVTDKLQKLSVETGDNDDDEDDFEDADEF
ncbi:hypothetical protein HDU76_004733 [Blyttiomyces sp. JEL0837]|nr:hypothetical protein HDU76_004733 [Blyttiomyces sp. JEL0837]